MSPGIALALDLARMPALAPSLEKTPLPADVFEIMRIATASPEVCQSASQRTGQPAAVLIEAARFYVQQILLRPDADPYRVLGLPPGASRELARRHLRCLLQWLHPDVNSDWDSVYAERVLKAWREVSANIDASEPSNSHSHGHRDPGSSAPVDYSLRVRMPWIKKPRKKKQKHRRLMPVAKRIGIAVAGVTLLVGMVIAVYATQSGWQ
jgi:hypothetical protein